MRIIFHIDVNSAYLSWTAVEQLKNGAGVDIRTIPAIIGGDQKSRHGIVLAKSISAKKYGIRTGEPVANAFRKCPNLKTYPPDHQMYHEYSRKLMEFLRTYTTHIEQVSVDECYMDFTEIADRFTSPVEGANEIKDEVYKRFGFTVNVGISSRKVLAKMASDFEKPNKVHTLFPEEVPVKMWPLPIGELFMAGRSSVETMKKLEIYKIGDLANTDPAILELHLKSHGRKLWEFANGLDDSPVMRSDYVSPVKSIGHGITTMQDLENNAEVWCVMLELVQEIGTKLRTHKKKAGGIAISIRNNELFTKEWQCRISIPTQSPTYLAKTAFSLFAKNYQWEHPIRSVTVRAINLFEEDCPIQYDLFTDVKSLDRQERLDAAIEQIRFRFGKDAIKNGVLFQKSKMPTERKVDLVMPTGMIG